MLVNDDEQSRRALELLADSSRPGRPAKWKSPKETNHEHALPKNTRPTIATALHSSLEFAELHGISGVAVSARAAVLLNAAKRDLVWFIQALSIAEGGLKRVARQLVEMFPKRLDSEDLELALRQHSDHARRRLFDDDDGHLYGYRTDLSWKNSWWTFASIRKFTSRRQVRR